MVSALGSSPTVEAAAQLLDCSAPAIHARARTDTAVAAAAEGQKRELVDTLAESILRHRGKLSRVAAELGLSSSQAVRYHIIRSAVLQQVYTDAREEIVDTAESNVFTAVEAGDLSYSWKLLQTLGKNRGYTERREIDATVTHQLSDASTGSLVQLLDRLATMHPEAVEAEFRELSSEERKALGEVLAEAAQPAQPAQLAEAAG